MSAPPITCSNCGEPVPFGRRSCEACGTPVSANVGFVPPILRDWPSPASPSGPAVAIEQALAEREAGEPPYEPDVVVMSPSAAPPATEAAEPPIPAPPLATPTAAAEVQPTPEPPAGVWLPPPTTHQAGVGPDAGPAASAAGSGSRPWAAGPFRSDSTATPSVLGTAAPAAAPAAPSTPGAPRWPDAPWSPAATPAPTPPAPAAAAPSPPEPSRATPGRAPLLADLPFDAPDSLPGWLVAAGAVAAVVGFFLPWAPQVLGSRGFGSYFDGWGFGAPANLPVFLVLLVTAGLSILQVGNRLATWIRHGVLGLAGGGLLLGIAWPYLVGGFGGMIGSFVEGFAAFLLLSGGFLAVAPARGDRGTH